MSEQLLSLLTPEQQERIKAHLRRVLLEMLFQIGQGNQARLANLLYQTVEIKEIEENEQRGFGSW